MAVEAFFGHDDNANYYHTVDGLLQRNLSDVFLFSSSSSSLDDATYNGSAISPQSDFPGHDDYCLNVYENISYLNISCETILSYSVPLYGYCTPFLLLTTVTANTLIVLVLNKRNMATPTNLVLMGKYFVIKYHYCYLCGERCTSLVHFIYSITFASRSLILTFHPFHFHISVLSKADLSAALIQWFYSVAQRYYFISLIGNWKNPWIKI